MSFSNQTKNSTTLNNQAKTTLDLTWNEADLSWNEIEGTWDGQNPVFIRQAKNSSSFSNEIPS